MPLPVPSCRVCAGVNKGTFWQYWFKRQIWGFELQPPFQRVLLWISSTCLSILLYFFSQMKPCSPPSFLLGTTNSSELYLELVTTIPLPAKWDAVEWHSGLHNHYWEVNTLSLRLQSRRIFSCKIDFCSLVRRIRIKCIREPHCLKNFRVCYSVSNILLIRMFHFESFCAYSRLWGQSKVTALRRNAGNNYSFQAGNILACRTNIYS